MSKNLVFLFTAVVSGTLLAGCASAPDKHVEEAYSALATADSLEADLYVIDLYQAAQDSFTAAQAEIESQEAVAGVDPDYTRAKELLAFVTTTANDAAAQVSVRKEEVRIETDSLIASAQARLTTAQEQLAAAPAESGSVSPVNLQENSASAQIVLQEAVEAQANGEFARANMLVREAMSKIEVIELELIPASPEAQRS